MEKVGVLGGGISGLSFASFVTGAEVLEKEETFGGLLRSVKEKGYTFDLGSHIIFSKNSEVLKFVLDLLGENKICHKRNTKIFYKGRTVKYPFENGLGDLPKDEAYECVVDYCETYIKREKGELRQPKNFKEWMYYRFGTAITEKYLYPYNERVWDYPTQMMDTFWVEGRVPQPPLKDVIKAGMGLETEGYTHQLNFYYPKVGGFQAISDGVKSRIDNDRLINNFEVEKVSKEDGKWVVKGKGKNGGERKYDRLVSTVHLRDFFEAYKDAPVEVREAARNLKWNSIYLVMIGLDNPKINDIHWAYIPDSDVLPNRISFPSNLSPQTVPDRHSSVLAEITFNPDGEKAKLKENEVVERTVEDLDRIGVIKRDEVDFTKLIKCKYAYVVYDLEYQKNIKIIEDFAKKDDLVLLGRFSEFRYYNSDKCIESAMEKAKMFE